MRIRTTSNETVMTTVEKEMNTLTGTLNSSTTTTNVGCKSSLSRRTHDVVTPHYWVRMRRGEIIVNPFERWESTITTDSPPKDYRLLQDTKSNGVWVLSIDNHGYCEGDWSARVRLPITPIACMESTARAAELANYGLLTEKGDATLAQCLEKATGSDALLHVTMAELDKTIGLFGQMAAFSGKMNRIVSFLGSTGTRRLNAILSHVSDRGYLRRGGRRRLLQDAGRELANLAGAWLGYRYGVMSTYYEILSYVDALGTPRYSRFLARNMTEYVSDTGSVLKDQNEWRSHYRRTMRRRLTNITAGVLVKPEMNNLGNRLGLNRPFTNLYELAPLSFVFDWVLDLGTQIAALEGQLAVKPLGTWLTYDHALVREYAYDYQYRQYENTVARYRSYGVNHGAVSETCLYRNRIANPRLGLLPEVHVKMNVQRLLDAVSLITVNARGIKRWST